RAAASLVVCAALTTPLLATNPVGATPAAGSVSPARGVEVRGSVEQVAVTGVRRGTHLRLLDATGTVLRRAAVDAAGARLFRHVAPAPGYRVDGAGIRSAAVTVTSPETAPPTSLFTDQRVSSGFGYVRTRDGTLLSVNVHLPGPASAGPYPTVIEYSGYDPSNPDGTPPGAQLAQLFGYPTVGVNLRRTGVSGGADDYFHPLQSLDGYDVVETIAAQPWVAGGRVGMVGISFSGITQLFVAATRPPHLAAITPLSVIDDTYDTLLP